MGFEQEYRKHYESIYRYAFRLLVDGDDARDITQEVFLKLFHQLNGNSDLQNMQAWLYRVTTNLSLNLLKSNRTRRKLISEHQTSPPPSNSAEEELLRKERTMQIKTALDSLPTRDRVLLTLYQDKLPYSEMARITGIKKSSIGKLLARAIDKLAKCGQTELMR
jgi:RNA polymerase sigma-70 factor (ECF subfamily)